MEELKQKLVENGFSISQDPLSHRGVSWYAWRPMVGAAHCKLNDKAPSLCILPWRIPFHEQPLDSVEAEVRGETQSDLSLSLRVYAVSPELVIDLLPTIEKTLKQAWNAVADNKG